MCMKFSQLRDILFVEDCEIISILIAFFGNFSLKSSESRLNLCITEDSHGLTSNRIRTLFLCVRYWDRMTTIRCSRFNNPRSRVPSSFLPMPEEQSQGELHERWLRIAFFREKLGAAPTPFCLSLLRIVQNHTAGDRSRFNGQLAFQIR